MCARACVWRIHERGCERTGKNHLPEALHRASGITAPGTVLSHAPKVMQASAMYLNPPGQDAYIGTRTHTRTQEGSEIGQPDDQTNKHPAAQRQGGLSCTKTGWPNAQLHKDRVAWAAVYMLMPSSARQGNVRQRKGGKARPSKARQGQHVRLASLNIVFENYEKILPFVHDLDAVSDPIP